ncbi:MAG TPA: class I SAM-dependent methyltransferase [Phycisphaerae bacterium]|nr:class I SAM-dependent methyltransferase [Phycisphaerae bacterium]
MGLACEVCGSRADFTPIADGRDYLVHESERTFRALRCIRCGFAFLDSRGLDATTYYSSSYFRAGEAPAALLGRLAMLYLCREARRLARMVPNARNILEIGPGKGSFLRALAATYPEARITGFDVSRDAGDVYHLDDRVRLCYEENLAKAGFEDGEFDLIVMRHVLEHVPRVRSFLPEINRVVGRACSLYVKVPNLESWAARIFGRHWYGFDFPRHLYYFTPDTLTRLLGGSGFRQTASGHENDAVDWAGSLRFWLAEREIGRKDSGRDVTLLALLGVRTLLLPLGTLVQAAHASSRLWVLARKDGE